MPLIDWYTVDKRIDDGEGVFYLTFKAFPCPKDETARPLTLDEIEDLMTRAEKHLNSYIHTLED